VYVELQSEGDSEPSEGINPLNLCAQVSFVIFRYMPLIMCAVYQYTFWSIRNKIYSKPRQTQFEKKVFEHQEATLEKLRKAILWFCIVSWYLIIADVIALFVEMFNPNKKSCDDIVFSGSMNWANSIIWIITRSITNLSSPVFALYMF
jgi:hypothetical protein